MAGVPCNRVLTLYLSSNYYSLRGNSFPDGVCEAWGCWTCELLVLVSGCLRDKTPGLAALREEQAGLTYIVHGSCFFRCIYEYHGLGKNEIVTGPVASQGLSER